jgi:hypothetical protein
MEEIELSRWLFEGRLRQSKNVLPDGLIWLCYFTGSSKSHSDGTFGSNITTSDSKYQYSELSNKHAANLILFEKIFPPTCLIRTYTLIYFQGKFLPTRLLEHLCLLFLAEIPNFKIILSSFKLLFCCVSTLKKQASLKLMQFKVFKSHNLIYT